MQKSNRVLTIKRFVLLSSDPRPVLPLPRGGALLAEVVNAEGGIHGRKIKYFIRDDQYSPAVAQVVVKELVEKQGIFAFTGGVSGAGGACGQGISGC